MFRRPIGFEPSERTSCVAVVVTHDRAGLLATCLAAIFAQTRRPDAVVVIDNASGPDTATLLRAHPAVRHLRLDRNMGAAYAFRLGIVTALADGAGSVWLMDDDGAANDPHCLERLLRTALEQRLGLVAPLIVDEAQPERLAFPLRLRGRTRFYTAEARAHGPVHGFAHLFNGALVRAEAFRVAGLPDPRLVMRGDEVEFLLRLRRRRVGVMLDTGAQFSHPGSEREIHPVAWGWFYAVVPPSARKQFYTFRNRAFIFSRYGLWHYLLVDLARYGLHYLARRHPDTIGYGRWLRLTFHGLRGDWLRAHAEPAVRVQDVSGAREREAMVACGGSG